MISLHMNKLENLNMGKNTLYSSGYFSGDYNQDLYLKRVNNDTSNQPKFYIKVIYIFIWILRQSLAILSVFL